MKTLFLKDGIIKTDECAFVMGIVNATPDSFWEGSRGGENLALKLIDEGADIIDVGGESTRPGAAYVSAEEEIRRIIPVIKKIRAASSVAISVDTRKKEVIEAAVSEGANILNDVSSLEDDEDIASFAAEKGIPVILMHKRGIPAIMQIDTSYRDVFREVDAYLASRVSYALSRGIEPNKIIVDPGIGFGKDFEANRILIKNCGKLCGGSYPVLMALSRKTCIGEMTGKRAEDRLCGTIAADMIAVMNGASIIRVHDVAAAVDSLRVMKALVD